jgi:pyruvate-formate lyase
MAYEDRVEPVVYTCIAEEAKRVFLEHEGNDPALARALALRAVVETCPIVPEDDAGLLGGEDPFFFNLMLPALQADRHSREGQRMPDERCERLRAASAFYATCFEGHITPGLAYVLGQGIAGLRARIELAENSANAAGALSREQNRYYTAALHSCESVLLYAKRLRAAAQDAATRCEDPNAADRLRRMAVVLDRVPEYPATTLEEALQAYWIVYCLVTLEMGGCMPGGGLGLGRLDQFLYPYFRRDIDTGVLTRVSALERLEQFLLAFRHVDYYTPHQLFTPGSQASLGGVTPSGADASNELTELIMEASLRIAMPTPYISLRLHREAPDRYWHAAAAYVLGGLGFPIVNDAVLIPAFLRHGRTITDARDYICSCCYENTIPGREAFHPNAAYLNLPLVLELALNRGRSLLSGDLLGCEAPDITAITSFDGVLAAMRMQLDYICDCLVDVVHAADRSHMENRRYPLMSLFIDDCIAKGADVCAGGARYNLTGCIASGLPNVVNSLAALRDVVFEQQRFTLAEITAALARDFDGCEEIRRALLRAPKWGNGDERTDRLAAWLTEALYDNLSRHVNPRGGRWQLALYSFVANHGLGGAVGASADGRAAREALTRNLNPTWGTDRLGPTAVLRSLSEIDFTCVPNGSSLDLRFDPGLFRFGAARDAFVGFLKGFVELGAMEMQITMADTETLLAARERPLDYPHLMVRVAGYSARFVDLSTAEQEEIIGRTMQGFG